MSCKATIDSNCTYNFYIYPFTKIGTSSLNCNMLPTWQPPGFGGDPRIKIIYYQTLTPCQWYSIQIESENLDVIQIGLINQLLAHRPTALIHNEFIIIIISMTCHFCPKWGHLFDLQKEPYWPSKFLSFVRILNELWFPLVILP